MARHFAILAHKDQKYGDLPYEYHLEKVAENVRMYTDDVYSRAAAYLHDTVEDTDVTFEKIFEEFGRRTARLVLAVTNEPGANRKEKATRTYPKIMAGGREAVLIKLADRIANVEHSVKHNHGMFKMYKKEYPKFRRSLKLPGELKEVWAKLDMLFETAIEE